MIFGNDPSVLSKANVLKRQIEAFSALSEQEDSSIFAHLAQVKQEGLNRFGGLKSFNHYTSDKGMEYIKSYDPAQDKYDHFGNVYSSQNNAIASIESTTIFAKLAWNRISHLSDKIWNSLGKIDTRPPSEKLFDSAGIYTPITYVDAIELRDIKDAILGWGIGCIGNGLVSLDQGLKKIPLYNVNFDKTPLEAYQSFVGNLPTKNVQDAVNFASLSLLSGGIVKGVKKITIPGYKVAKQEIKLLEYFPEDYSTKAVFGVKSIKPKDLVLDFKGDQWVIADRVVSESLKKTRYGHLNGKLTPNDILEIAHSKDAKAYYSYKVKKITDNTSKIDYSRPISVNVFTELKGLPEGKILRITIDPSSKRIYSVGTVSIKDFLRDIARGRYNLIGK
jgi:hypothetical protein